VKSLGVLDRYVLRQWIATFLLSVIGVPAMAVLIDLSEQFGHMVDRGVPLRDIFLGEAYLFPAKMAMLFPAGVLFATVFTLNGMGRRNELTAVKAGGISFYRLIVPMMILALVAVPANFGLQELASYTTTRQQELQGLKASSNATERSNFAFASPSGWTWVGKEIYRSPGRALGLLGEGPAQPGHPRWSIMADSASWVRPGKWIMHGGSTYAVVDSGDVATFTFRHLVQRTLTQPPATMMNEEKKPEELTIGEMKAYVDQLQRSGTRLGMLKVDYPLKYAIPVACIIVALFGAPLAVTNPRAGAALGLAIALGTTLVYLTGTQIMKAIGGKDIVSPIFAAWSMNVVFLAIAIVLLFRVRT
jgi:lipopolysaccharide export system permease protein